MPRLTVSTPKYRHHRASGQAVVTIAGTDHYLGPWKSCASKIEYDRLIGEWLAAGRPTTPRAPVEQITVAEVINGFRLYAERHYVKNGRSTGTAETFKPVLSILRQYYGNTLAADFGPLALKALRLRMIEKDGSRRYINDNVERVRRVFIWAAGEELIPHTVPAALKNVEGLRKGHGEARETEPKTPIDDATVEATLPRLSKVVADMVRLQRLTGSRPGEICQIRPCDVDRSGEVWKYVPEEHKTEHHGKRRVIFIGPKGQDILRPYLLRDAESYCFSPSESERRRLRERHERRVTPLSCGNVPSRRAKSSRLGDRYDSHSYRRAVHRACDLAFPPPETLPETELPAWQSKHRWSPHRLRHTAATEIRAQFGLEAAQVALGHSRADVTQIYAAKNEDLAVRVALAVG